MTAEWRDLSLGDLFKVKHGFAFKGENFTDEPQETVLVTPGNFAIGGGFQDDKRKYYRGLVPGGYVLQPGQIVVTMTDLSKQSDTLGYAASIPNDSNVWLHNQRVGLLVFKPDEPTVPRFVEYLLRSHEYRSWVVGSATGTTVKHTSPGRIESFKTRVPPPAEQSVIAHILGSLDDKIKLNRKTNQTLEQIAQAIFKSWFVDFEPTRAKIAAKEAGATAEEIERAAMCAISGKSAAELAQLSLEAQQQLKTTAALFPDALIESELGKIPAGWIVKTIDEVTALIIDHRGKTPMKLGGDWAGDGYPTVSAKNIKSGRITSHDSIRFVNEDLYKKWMKDELTIGDILLTSEAPMGEMFFLTDETKYCLSQRLYGLRADSNKITPSFLYLWLRSSIAKSDLEGRATGTTVVGIRQSELRKVKVLVPLIKIAVIFEELAFPLYQQLNKNDKESQTLAETRNKLMPKLLNGSLADREE